MANLKLSAVVPTSNARSDLTKSEAYLHLAKMDRLTIDINNKNNTLRNVFGKAATSDYQPSYKLSNG